MSIQKPESTGKHLEKLPKYANNNNLLKTTKIVC